jgi:outer membrane protein assembly factor BamB
LSAKLGGVTTGSDGILYALTRTGWLYALTPSDGSLLWARQLPGSQEYGLPPTLVQTTLLAASQGNVARAFSLGSLSTLWSRTVADELVTPPCASESLGLAYVGTEHGAVYALRLSTGVLAWSIQTSSQVAGLARDDRHVYVTSTDGAVSAWDGATGGPVWAVTTGDRISAPPLTDGNGVLVTTQGGKVLFFAAATGQEMESRRMIFADAFSQGAAPAGGWLFLRGSNLYGVGP